MGLIAIASAKGSPGVTTTSLLFGGLWPRPALVAECDPSGGDVAWRMPAADGKALDPQRGLVSLIAAGRRSLYPELVHRHSQTLVGGLEVLLGVAASEQASGLGQWETLADLFAEMPGTDAICDLGRIGASTPQNALLSRASAVVMCVDTVPSNVVHLRERLQRLREVSGRVRPATYVAVVAPSKRTRAVREIRELLERHEVPLMDGVHHVVQDPAGAGFFLGQVRGNALRTQLVRSARPFASELAARTEPFFVAADSGGGEDDGTEAAGSSDQGQSESPGAEEVTRGS